MATNSASPGPCEPSQGGVEVNPMVFWIASLVGLAIAPTFSDFWLGQSHTWDKVAQNRKQNRKFGACTLGLSSSPSRHAASPQDLGRFRREAAFPKFMNRRPSSASSYEASRMPAARTLSSTTPANLAKLDPKRCATSRAVAS